MQGEYPVLATLSGSYPEVKGRLLTCYSPVRRSSTPEGAFPLDLHVLSTPPAFVLSQDQTLREMSRATVARRKRRRRDRAGAYERRTSGLLTWECLKAAFPSPRRTQ